MDAAVRFVDTHQITSGIRPLEQRKTPSEGVLAAADGTMLRITEQYFAPSLSIEELRERVRSASADPLKSFSEACRKELDPMRVAADRMRLERRNFLDAAEPHSGR